MQAKHVPAGSPRSGNTMSRYEFREYHSPTADTLGRYAEGVRVLGEAFNKLLETGEPYNLLDDLEGVHTIILAVEKRISGLDPRVVGYATLWHRDKHWELSSTYVDEHHRRLGIAGEMMDRLILTASREKARYIETTSAIPFQEVIAHMLLKRGFLPSGNGMTDFYRVLF